jgi:hypothetical protein
LAVVAPLSEMVRFAHRYHPRQSGHGIVALSGYHWPGSFGLKPVPDFFAGSDRFRSRSSDRRSCRSHGFGL